MLAYPSIPGVKRSRQFGEQCIAFYKYDGSNLRWEWSPKKQWYKFGSRTQLIDRSSEQFAPAFDLFQNTMADDIAKIICDDQGKKKVERIVAFTEFYGPSSFAGWHEPSEQKDLVLIDVSVYKQGFLLPEKFVELFGAKDYAAEVVYSGPMDQEFITKVRQSYADEGPLAQYNLMEGVVCKGDDWNAKIKTQTYLDKLKAHYGEAWEQYGE